MKISFGSGKYGVCLIVQDLTFKQFANKCNQPVKGTKYGQYFLRGSDLVITKGRKITTEEKKQKKHYLREDHFHKNNKSLKSANLLIVDGDSRITKSGNKKSGAPKAKLAHKILKKSGIKHFIYTTHSHSKNKNKWRAVIPCDIAYSEHQKNQSSLNNTYAQLINMLNDGGCNIELANEALTWSQAWYMPSRDNPEDGLFEFYEYHKGKKYQALRPEQIITTSIKGQTSTVFDKDIDDIMTEIETGEHIYEPLRKLIYMEAKQGMPAETISRIYHTVATVSPLKQSDHRRWKAAFDQIPNLVRGAVDRARQEEVQIVVKDKEKTNIKSDFPIYDHGMIDKWPKPFPYMWSEFKAMSFDPSEVLIHPTFVSFHAYLLKSRYRTVRGRRPQMLNLTLASSTGGKDINSTDILYKIANSIDTVHRGVLKDSKLFPYGFKTHGTTSDSAFLEALNDKQRNGNWLWTNTEATNFYEMLKNSNGSNSHVSALQDLMNEVADGRELYPKNKSGKVIDGHANPNIQINFYAQIDTVFKSITDRMLHGGLLGRNEMFIDYKKLEIKNTINMTAGRDYIKDDLVNFYKFAIDKMSTKIQIIEVHLTDRANKVYADWVEENIVQASKEEDEGTKLLWGRLPLSGEKLYTVIFAWQNLWRKYKGKKVKTKFDDIECIFPYLLYQKEVRKFVANYELDNSNDVIEDAIMQTIKLLLSGNAKDMRHFRKHGIVPRRLIWSRIRMQKKLKDRMEKRGSSQDMYQRVSRTIDAMIKNQTLIQTHGSGKYQHTECLKLGVL